MSNLTSILGTDLISNAPSVLNANFNALNSSKVETIGGTLTSPSLIGTPVAPTASAGTNTTQVATTAFVNNALAGTLPTFITTSPYEGTLTATALTLDSSVLSQIGLFQLPIGMIVNRVSVNIPTVTTAGTIRLGIYNITGQTQVTSVLLSSVTGTGIRSTNVSSVALNAGSYYYAVTPLEGSHQIRSVAPNADLELTGSVFGKARYASSVAVVGGALPTTFNPVTMGINNPNFINIRLDN